MSVDRATRLKGLLIVGGGVLILTPDSLLVRLSDSGPWSLMVVRGLLMAAGVLFGLALLYGPRRLWWTIRQMGMPGLWATLLYGTGNLLFVVALDNTAVANVLVMIATVPVFGALLSWVFLREAIGWPTALAILAALVGIGVVVSDSLGQPVLVGDLSALGVALMMASFYVVLRRHRTRDLVPAVGLSGLVSAGIAVVPLLAIGPGFGAIAAYSGEQWGWIVLNAFVVLPLSFSLMAVGPRYLPAAEIGLLLLLETVLGPLWVWWALNEAPGTATLIGGAIVLVTLLLHTLWQLRPRRRAAG